MKSGRHIIWMEKSGGFLRHTFGEFKVSKTGLGYGLRLFIFECIIVKSRVGYFTKLRA